MRDQHRRLVLHGTGAVSERAPGCRRSAVLDDETFRRIARRRDPETVFLRETLRQRFAREAQRVRAHGDRRPLVHRMHQGRRLVDAVPIHPARGKPRRKGEPDGERFDRIDGRRWVALARPATVERA